MRVVVTAGHVDHGKSTVIRALTGRDPDRLEEERRRGLSIELGYAWTELDGVGEVAFVDVPGHQRFVTTALAGMGPVPVALLAVAADDPWMPQTEEHVAALDALGVEHGLLVVTRCDLADPAAALAAARSRLATTSLRDVPHVAVSARTGAGMANLRACLADVLRDLPDPDPRAPVRMWIDRAFHIRGAGTVVTGTLERGTITIGDLLAVDGAPVRVRGLESLERSRDSVSGVARVAVRLGGRAPDVVRRGRALTTPGTHPTAATVDVRLEGPPDPPSRPLLHVGSASQQVHVRPLSDGFVRLRLSEPLPLVAGDRAVLRDPGSRAVWGVSVVAADPPALRRRGDGRRRGQALARGEADPEPAPPEAPEPVTEAATAVPDEEQLRLVDGLRALLDGQPFAAPHTQTLADLGLDDRTAARLHAAGLVLRVAPGIVLLPGAEERAAEILRTLPSPFTTSAARQALGTSRRVVLPLLAHLDRTGHTVRLADDRRRLRG